MNSETLRGLLAGVDLLAHVAPEMPDVEKSSDLHGDLPLAVFSLQETQSIPTLDEGPVALTLTYSVLIITEKHVDLDRVSRAVMTALRPHALAVEVRGDDADQVLGFYARGLTASFAGEV